MSWATFKHTLEEVDQAGLVLSAGSADPGAVERAEAVVDNWRRAHSFPLNTFQVCLRSRAQSVDHKPLVAQRLKRMQSIRFKLQNNHQLREHLSEMQDIGGCRAILRGPEQVSRLVAQYREPYQDHEFEWERDYITRPKRTGYRGVHRVYRYRGEKEPHCGRRIEIQFRTQAQHIWATAVETAGTYKGMPLKSNKGDKDWLRFFALMGSVIAVNESLPTVPGTPADEASLAKEIADLQDKLGVLQKLSAYQLAGREISEKAPPGAKHFVLELDTEERRLLIAPFNKPAKAGEYVLEAEKRMLGNPNLDVVQVKVESLKALRRAYPNYFADTTEFVRMVDDVLSGVDPIEPEA